MTSLVHHHVFTRLQDSNPLAKGWTAAFQDNALRLGRALFRRLPAIFCTNPDSQWAFPLFCGLCIAEGHPLMKAMRGFESLSYLEVGANV